MRKVFFDIGPRSLKSEGWMREWRDYQIIGFEPDPEAFKKIVSEFPGILLNYAIGDEDGVLSGQLTEHSGFIVGGFDHKSPWVKVRSHALDTIDKLFGGFDKCRIWADIEGSELRMLKGAENVLKKTDWIKVEVRNKAPHKDWCTAEEVYDFLRARGFYTKTPIGGKGHYDVIFTKTI